VDTVNAIFALCRRKVSPLKAKRAVEKAMQGHTSILAVPMVENIATLKAELFDAGFIGNSRVTTPVDVATLRKNLGLSQEDFSLRFNLDLNAIRNWEQHRRVPDIAAVNYLRMIEKAPEIVDAALFDAYTT
jgi:DNA-binding transcriptional regulator YiaG